MADKVTLTFKNHPAGGHTLSAEPPIAEMIEKAVQSPEDLTQAEMGALVAVEAVLKSNACRLSPAPVMEA